MCKPSQTLKLFLSTIGPEAYKLLRSLVAPTSPGEKSYIDLMKVICMTDHHCPPPSEIVQRYCFIQDSDNKVYFMSIKLQYTITIWPRAEVCLYPYTYTYSMGVGDCLADSAKTGWLFFFKCSIYIFTHKYKINTKWTVYSISRPVRLIL